MDNRPDLTDHQRKVVDRYYQHKDTIHATKLGELVSEIAVEADPKKLDRLWKSAGEYRARCGVEPPMIAAIFPSRNLRLFGEVAGAIMSGTPLPRVPLPQK